MTARAIFGGWLSAWLFMAATIADARELRLAAPPDHPTHPTGQAQDHLGATPAEHSPGRIRTVE